MVWIDSTAETVSALTPKSRAGYDSNGYRYRGVKPAPTSTKWNGTGSDENSEIETP